VENPAVHLYSMWREIIRWHAETQVDWFREQAQSMVESTINNGGRWLAIQEDGEIERWTTKGMYTGSGNYHHAPLDYRMGLRVVGITDRHIFDTPTLGPDMTVFEPIIRLQVQHNGWYSRNRGKTVPLMDLYPNGDFKLLQLPSTYHQIFPRWTFFRTSWVASHRQWIIPPLGKSPLLTSSWQRGWVSWDVTDWNTPIPYLPNHSFVVNGSYMLQPDIHGFWRITTQRDSPVGEYDFKIDGDSAILLRKGYAASQRRYQRFERSSESAKAERTRDKIAIYVPGEGRRTGVDAVEQFSQHMRVFEPVKATEEATEDGTDRLVTSPVHQQTGVAPG